MVLTLWLSPGDSDEERYRKLIGDMAQRFDTAIFAPHITLLSRLPDDVAAAREVVSRVVDESGFAAFDLPILGVSTSGEYYRCVALDLHLTDELRNLRRAAESITGLRLGDEYRPHLSLLYGELSSSERKAAGEEIGSALPTSVRIEWLDIERTEGEVAQWCRESRVRLGA